MLLEDSVGQSVTRVVSASGDVGDAVPLAPPATSSDQPARFAIVDDYSSGASVYLRRFDAEGRALDREGLALTGSVGTNLTPAMLARSGDTFVAATFTVAATDAVQIFRVRDTGERIDVTPVVDAELDHAPFGGLGCSPTECVITFGRTKKSSGPDRNEVWIARFATHDPEVQLVVSRLDTGVGGTVVFDGEHFLVAYARDDELRIARLEDDGPRFASSQLGADQTGSFTSIGDGTALLFSEFPTQVGDPARDVQRIDVRRVLGERSSNPGAGGGGGGRGGGGGGGGGGGPMASTPTAVARACACELGEERGGSWSVPLLALAAALAARRRR